MNLKKIALLCRKISKELENPMTLEKEDREIEELHYKEPRCKPPRRDLRKRYLKVEDPDMEK